jgi:hypothetical protein
MLPPPVLCSADWLPVSTIETYFTGSYARVIRPGLSIIHGDACADPPPALARAFNKIIHEINAYISKLAA